MPTEPFKKLLDRDFAKVNAKPIIDIASPLLIEGINHATMAFQRCLVSAGRDTSTGAPGEHLAALMLYEHVIEMADGLECLISNSCSGPALPVLRSMLEALLSLEYVLTQDYRRRSLSWLCCYLHRQIESYELLDQKTDRGKELKNRLYTEANSGMTVIGSSQIRRFQKVLAGELCEIEAEYQSQKKAHKRIPKWHSLFGGPKSLRALADKLSRLVYYDLLYRHWSSVTHATDASRFLSRSSDGGAAIHSLRNPCELQDYTWLAVEFVVIATGMMIGKFRPGEDLNLWYNTEVKPRLDYLKNVHVETISVEE